MGRAKPARGGRVKTGHLEERVIRGKAVFGPWWTEEARHGESSQDGRRTDHTGSFGRNEIPQAIYCLLQAYAAMVSEAGEEAEE